MTARYPGQAMVFQYRQNVTDLIQAQDVNVLYDEAAAVGATLGLDPATSGTWGAAQFSSATTSWSTVAARLQNIENGVYTGVNSRVSTLGGSTITPSTTGTVGVIVKAAASQSADLLQAQTSAGTVVTKISADGTLYYNGKVVATRDATETLTNKTLSSTAIDGTQNTVTNLAPSSVVVTSGTNIQQYVDAKPAVYYTSLGSRPTSGLKDGDIWVDKSSTATAFDSSAFLTNTAASTSPSSFGFKRITASTSAPTNSDGADGDVWLQYV